MKQRFAEDDHVQAVEALIAQANHRELHEAYRGTGSKPYPPERLLAIVTLLILQGVGSPAKWAKHAKVDDRCRLVGRGHQPSRSTMYNFRDRAAKFIHAFHARMIREAIAKQVINPEQGCLDGTFVAASASRHKMLTLDQISQRLGALKRAISQWDDARQAASRRPLKSIPYWLARTATGRTRQLQDYHAAKARILEEIKLNRTLPSDLRRKEENIKISPADVDAVIGKDKLKTTRPLYNAQTMCDFDSDVILCYGVFRKKNDSGTLIPMAHQTHQVIGRHLTKIHADSGYCSLLELKDCAELKIDLYAPVAERNSSNGRLSASGEPQLPASEFSWKPSSGVLNCPAGHPMRQVSRSKDPRADGRHVIELRFEQQPSRCGKCQLASKCLALGSRRRTVRRLEDQPLLDSQKAKMQSDSAQSSNRTRKMRVERRFADSKRHRDGSELHGRGLIRATAEIGLKTVAQNCLTLYLRRKRGKIASA